MNKFEEKKLREYVRNKLEYLHQENLNEAKSISKIEDMVRKKAREILLEAGIGSDSTTSRSTGINVLASTLKQVVPIIKQAYAQLTTSDGQKKSFRAHIIQNAINTLMKVDILSTGEKKGGGVNADEPEESAAPTVEPDNPELEPEDELAMAISDEEEKEAPQEITEAPNPDIDLDVDVDPDNEIPDLPEGEDKFIDIDEKPKKETKGGAAQDIPFVKIPSMDKTGMELAQRTFPKVQKQVGDAYSILSDPTDRDEYADYLVANLKLYFDQFDQESSPDIPEPESDPYNQIKQRSAQLSGIQENLVFTKLMKMLKG